MEETGGEVSGQWPGVCGNGMPQRGRLERGSSGADRQDHPGDGGHQRRGAGGAVPPHLPEAGDCTSEGERCHDGQSDGVPQCRGGRDQVGGGGGSRD